MVKISTEAKLDNFRNMRAMIADYIKQYSRFPTSKEFEEKLNMSEATVKRYKKIILQENKQKILDEFHHDMIIHVEKSFETINKNIKIFEEIRDNSGDNDEKMIAAKYVLESHLDAIRIMNDAPEYLGLEYDGNDSNDSNDNNVQDEQEYIHRQIDSEITEGIKAIDH